MRNPKLNGCRHSLPPHAQWAVSDRFHLGEPLVGGSSVLFAAHLASEELFGFFEEAL